MAGRWYVIHVYSGFEKKVAQSIREQAEQQGIAVAVAMQGATGRNAWEFAKGARAELRKVVWPSNKETMQMTLVVFGMVVLIAVFLWVVDWGLLKIVRALSGRGA